MALSHHVLDDPVIKHAHLNATTLREEMTVEEALADLRMRPLSAKIVYLYVLDADERLVGVLPTRALLTGAPEARIRDIMLKTVIAIPYLATVLEACEWFIQYRLLAFPLVDGGRKLMGVVDIGLFTDEIIEVSAQRQLDDAFQLLGMQVSCLRTASPLKSFQGRFPWLLCNVGGGLACAVLTARYEGLLSTAIVLALFIPVVLALSESVSMQSTTITLQRFHGQRQGQGMFWSALGREFVVALLLGVACGLLVGGTAYFWKGDAKIAVVIGGCIVLAMITSCGLGVVLPTVVHTVRADPRIAAGPIVLATADVITLLMYFSLALWLVG